MMTLPPSVVTAVAAKRGIRIVSGSLDGHPDALQAFARDIYQRGREDERHAGDDLRERFDMESA